MLDLGDFYPNYSTVTEADLREKSYVLIGETSFAGRDKETEKADIQPEVTESEPDYSDDEEYKLKVGDVIEFDDGMFQIESISESIEGRGLKYELRDLGSVYPVFRVEYEDELY